MICSMCSCFLDAIQTRLGSNQLTQILGFPPSSQEKFGGDTAKKDAKSEKLFECKRCAIDWLAKVFTLSLIGYTSTCETAVRHSDWLYSLFSHVKIKHIDFCR